MVELTIKKLLEEGIEKLGEGDYLNPLLDAQILLSFLLEVDKIYLYTHRNQVVDEKTQEEFLKLIDLRKTRYPLQYIVGSQEFMGLDFRVGEGVLIPRPDTEVLVEKIIELTREERFFKKDNLKIVDIGTGSGAITLSLAHYLESAFVYSVDISKEALKVARENARRLDLEKKVQFLHGSIFEPLHGESLENKVDILVSNPPYIPSKVIEGLQIEVSTHEPKLALDGGVDGLDFYRKLVDGAPKFLTKGGLIAFEIGHDQGSAVSDLLLTNGNFKNVEVLTDLSGLDRVVIGEKD